MGTMVNLPAGRPILRDLSKPGIQSSGFVPRGRFSPSLEEVMALPVIRTSMREITVRLKPPELKIPSCVRRN
jgi:hypothetical protein